MKIRAVLMEAVLPSVVERLLLIGVDEVVVSSVRVDLPVDQPIVFRGARYAQTLVERCVLECWLDDDDAEPAVRAIRQSVERAASEASIWLTPTE